MPDHSPSRDNDPVEQSRPGRSGADVGDETAGEGSEFAGDATVGTAEEIDPEPDPAGSWLKAHGSD